MSPTWVQVEMFGFESVAATIAAGLFVDMQSSLYCLGVSIKG
jgi:hypothetical protein